jgi:hypothetical protein
MGIRGVLGNEDPWGPWKIGIHGFVHGKKNTESSLKEESEHILRNFLTMKYPKSKEKKSYQMLKKILPE